MEKVIKRGYVKWEDENGFHKEPLSDHPELLVRASAEDQLRAEEVKRLNAAAEEKEEQVEDNHDVEDTLKALKAAPEDVLTAAQLVETDNGNGETVIKPASEVEEAPILVAPASAPEEIVAPVEEPANGDSNNNGDNTDK